ncbi:MAG TPA: LamG domain-containing protein, partial [Phycisphaerales bacterium]|nr:LamG domain-containing protein [Phycisphaerales bacterium]
MRGKTLFLMALLLAVVVGTAPAQLITSVVRSGGQSGNRDPIGAYTGTTQPLPTQDGGVKDGNYIFSDRTYTWASTPTGTLGPQDDPLIGSEYIRTFNSDKDSAASNVTYTVTFSRTVFIWITVDNRFADPQAYANTVTQRFAPPGTFQDTGLDLYVGGDNDRPLSVWGANFGPGTYVFVYQGSTSNNNYIIGAVRGDPTFNPPPVVSAGPDVVVAKPVFPQAVQLNGTVSDLDPEEPEPGQGPWELSMEWSLVSGPAAVEFSDATIEDPMVTITAPGTYVLQLYATDTEKDASDTVTLYVNDPSQNQLMAHWDFEAMQAVKGATVLDVANGNDGVWVTDGPDPNALPNIIPGWITGSTQALELNSPAPSHIDVTISDTEPNFVDGPRFAMTISSWIKVDQFSRTWSTLVSKGDNSWRMARQSRSNTNNNAMCVHFSGLTPGPGMPGNGPNGTISVNDNFWHHVCGTYDGEMIRLYVDGVLDVAGPYTGLINTSTYPVMIGENAQATNRIWDGAMDDLRIYNYALDEAEIRAMTALGKVPPQVSVEPFAEPIKYKWGE